MVYGHRGVINRRWTKRLIFSFLVCSAPLLTAQATTLVTSATQKELEKLPPPELTPHLPKFLTLDDAITLALRNNPAVHSSRFQRISDKWALELANYAYQPHFNLTGNTTFTVGQKTGYNVNPGLTINNIMGTQVSISNVNDLQGNQQELISVTQPLLRGFGAVNKIPWLNAQDQEQMARLNFKNSIMDIVTQVITNYRQVVEDEHNVTVQEKALKNEEETAKEYRLRVQAGKMASSELLQEEANLANARLQTLRQQNTLEQDYQTLLDTLGLSPVSKLHVNTQIDFRAPQLPSAEEAVEIALNHNLSYLSQKLALNAAERSVMSAKDALRWQLNLIGSTTFATSSGSIPVIDGFQSFSTTQGTSGSIQLTIPFRDLSAKAALVNAKVALVQSEDAFEQSKRTLTRQVINALTNLRNQYKQLAIAEQGVELQRKNLEAEEIKQRYGKSTALNVNIIQNNLLQQEIDYINSQINYLNNVTNFENLLGKTLDDWGIEMRY